MSSVLRADDFAGTHPIKTRTYNSEEFQEIVSGLTPVLKDYVALTYIAAGNGAGEIETVTYKYGGASGTTTAVLTLTYDGSNRLSTVTSAITEDS